MRVLHVVRTLGHGGMERNLRRVVVATHEQGIEHAVVLLNDQTEILEMPEWCPVHRAVTAPRDPRMPLLIARIIREVRPDVIHARNRATWPDTAAARLVAAPSVPLIFSYHGMEATSATRLQRLEFRALSRVTSRIFAVSEAARSVLVDQLGIRRSRVGVILNGVDTDRFSPGDHPPRGRFVVGAVGRYFEIKNFPLLIRAVERALRGGLDVELRLAGDGPEESRYRALGAALGLGDRLQLAGRVEDVPAFLRDLDLFVLSSDNEANPNALLEAMAAGLCCVSTAVGGAREVLDGGRCGYLVPPGDELALAGAITRMAGDRGLRSKLGERARAHVMRRYSQARMFELYAELYRNPITAKLD